ncbi:GNAT family N-acetyltransferase [Metabacillus herbersteinensis]|uniref:GNAT family N-acetyltransferase n=1 Tax=Metabacillus herbersteinensis TaxID=283816 RepID=A0ABV6GDA7_9BACI
MGNQELVKKIIAKNRKVVILRPVKINDAEQIVEAVKTVIYTGAYIQKEKPRTVEEEREFITTMQNQDNMYLAIEIDGTVVGIARVVRGELEMKRHIGLFRTWLAERAQGLGIGKEIMTYTLEWCRLHQLHKLCLTVFASNGLAQKLYERYGFVQEGIQKEQVKINGQYDDEIFMAYFF